MKKWKFKNETPEFDGEYLCHIRVTEECGNKYKKYRVVVNTFNTWIVDSNEEVLAWKELYAYPIDENKEIENYTDTLQGLVSDVGNILSEYDIEWQQAGYFNHAKQLLEMKPTSYKEIKSGVFEFFYNEDDYNNFHKNGKESGDVGFIIKERDYWGKFTKYEGYGTIESPNKDLNYITIQHSKFFDGEFLSPQELTFGSK